MPSIARRVAVVLAGALLVSATTALGQDQATEPADGGEPNRLSLSEEGGKPAAGRYANDSLGVDLEFTLGDEWAYGSGAAGFGVDLSPDFEGDPLLTISEVNGWVFERPCVTEGDDTYWDDHPEIDLDATSIIEHFAANPYMQNDGAVPATIAGVEGLQLDVDVALGRRCELKEVPLWASFYGEGETDYYSYTLYDGASARIFAFEAEGKTILVLIEATGDEPYAAMLDIGMPVVESLSLASADGSAE